MYFIGDSVREAIDWTQDALGAGSTRPEAEAVLFQLLAEKLIRETDDGFVLLEHFAEDSNTDDDASDRFRARRRLTHARFRFHHMRHVIHQENQRRRRAHHMRTLQQNDAADDMLAAEDADDE
jgi:hypothetical protein